MNKRRRIARQEPLKRLPDVLLCTCLRFLSWEDHVSWGRCNRHMHRVAGLPHSWSLLEFTCHAMQLYFLDARPRIVCLNHDWSHAKTPHHCPYLFALAPMLCQLEWLEIPVDFTLIDLLVQHGARMSQLHTLILDFDGSDNSILHRRLPELTQALTSIPRLVSVHLESAHTETFLALHTHVTNGLPIERIELYMTLDADTVTLFERLCTLTTLKQLKLTGDMEHTSEPSFRRLGSLSMLECVVVDGDDVVAASAVESLCQCPRLTSLEVSVQNDLTLSRVLAALARRSFKTLRLAIFNDWDEDEPVWHGNDDVLRSFWTAQTALQFLELKGPWFASLFRSMTAHWKTPHQLHHFGLRNEDVLFDPICGPILLQLLRTMTAIETLVLSEPDHLNTAPVQQVRIWLTSALQVALTHMPRLRTVQVSNFDETLPQSLDWIRTTTALQARGVHAEYNW